MNAPWHKQMRAAFILFLCALSLHAEDPKYQAHVRVDFSGDDSLKSDVVSYVKRELRSLADVRVTDSDEADYIIALDVQRRILVVGHPASYLVTFLVTQPLHTNVLAIMAKPEYVNAFGDYVKVDRCGTWYGPDLRGICADVVTEFDSHELDAARALFEKVAYKAQSVSTNDVPDWTNTIPDKSP